jgi:transposase InsO family protein
LEEWPGTRFAGGESFVSRLRDEFLDGEVLLSVLDGQVRLSLFRRYWNEERLHSSLGYWTPNEFAVSWRKGITQSSKLGEAKEPTGT